MSRLDIIKNDQGQEIIKYNIRVDPNQPDEFINPKTFTVCGAWLREKERPCFQPAGKKTDHVGWGRCYLHGGATQSPISARNQKKLSLIGEINYPGLKQEIERIRADKDVFDLREEVATMEAIANKILEKAETIEDTLPVINILERATRVAQRLHEIEEGKRLTIHVSNIHQIIENIITIINRYVVDEYTKSMIARDLMDLKIGSGFPRPEPKLLEGTVVNETEGL